MTFDSSNRTAKSRPYTYYDFTLSLCSKCLGRVDAKVVFENGHVYLLKRCPDHGKEKCLIATDIDYYKRCRNYLKPGEMPLRFNTKTEYGCPYDCGLCPDHEQHSCLTLLEITDRCNLTCPTCYASSSPTHGRHRSVDEITKMLHAIVANEGTPDVVQISGGEPTIHPDFLSIVALAKQQPIRHLMVNTNGIRIAKDREFVRQLAAFMPDFEIYLQFDSLQAHPLQKLRGEDLRHVRNQALEHLNEFNLSTTLVVTLEKGLNTGEIGEIIDFALSQPCVRGVTFQPTQIAGRLTSFNPETDRLTLTEVRNEILRQSTHFTDKDLLPVPCNPDALVMGYALKLKGEVVPLTRYIDPDLLLQDATNTIVYEQDPQVRDKIIELFSTGSSPIKSTSTLKELLCCLPKVSAPDLGYQNLFRVIIMQFLDAYNFDVRSVKRSCVHIVTPDGKLIPFDTMNLFYREELSPTLVNIRSHIYTGRK